MNSKSQMINPDEKPGAKAVKSRQRVIGARLQAMYDDVVRQGVPDDFEKILSALDDLDGSQPDEPDSSSGRKG